MDKEELNNQSPSGDSGRPECFGDGDRVCPEDEHGFMQPQSACLPCAHLRACMQTVLHQRGRIRLVADAEPSKVGGFLKRWSDQKLKDSKNNTR